MSARGERLGNELAPEVRSLIYEPRLQRELAHALGYMHAVNQAHLLMLVERDLMPRATARIVAREMLALEALGAADLPNDPALEDLYFNYESALTSRVGVAAAGSLHIGRSRNDIGATTDRMRARDGVLDLVAKVNDVRQALLDQAQCHADVVMPGYTHLQPSQPITFGFYLLGVATAFARDVERLLAEYDRVNRSPLGAAAMAGTSFPIDRDLTARALGFSGVTEHSLDAVASRDYMIALCATCASLSIAGSRLAQDFYVWSTMEFGLIEFSDSIAGVSSIMPQKKNPVVLEVLKANAGEVIGDYTAMLATMRATHFTHSIDATRSSLNRAWTMIETCRSSAMLQKLLVESVIPCQARMRSLSATNFITMTDLADFLARRDNLTFREAHHVVGHLVRMAIERGIAADRITAAMVAEAATAVLAKPLSCAPEEMAELLDPANSIDRRVSVGSPAPSEIARMIDEQRKALARSVRSASEASRAVEASREALTRSIAALAA
jgi:argininosuccinate lyase